MKSSSHEAAVHPATAMPDKSASLAENEIGDDQYVELKRVLKLEAAVDFAIETRVLTTYKPVGKVSGFFWRDQNFHFALGAISKSSIATGGGAKSAVVTRADNQGKPTRPGRQFFTLLEEARPKQKIARLPSGEYDQAACEEAWLREMELLGYDVAPFLGTTRTYYAVLHGERGNQTFAPMRQKPGVSQLLFAFEGPALDDDAALNAYFAKRFLPLNIFYFEDGEAHKSDTFPTFVEAAMFAGAVSSLHSDVRILTQDGREVWHSKPPATPQSNSDSEIVSELMEACVLQGIPPTVPFANAQDFKAFVLQQFWHPGEVQKDQQLAWLSEAVRQAKKGSVSGVVECIKSVRLLA